MFRSIQSRGDRMSAPAIDMAPLIDIVFILLIFFLVTTTFVRDTGVDVVRPQAKVTRTLDPASMRISIASSGEIYSEGSRISLSELRARVAAYVSRERDHAIIVIPDVDVPSGRLIEVMDAARQGGAKDVAVATEKKGSVAP